MGKWMEARHLTRSRLLGLCLENKGWYSLGSEDDFENLCAVLCDGQRDLDSDVIMAIAEDIAAHSAVFLPAEEIACKVAEACHSYFYRSEPSEEW